MLAMGIDHYIDMQLHPESVPEDPTLAQQLAALGTLKLDPEDILAHDIRPEAGANGGSDKDTLKARREAIDREAIDQRYLRAIESTRQLQEVMVDFWFNHFNVFCCSKGLFVRPLVGSFELEAIRPHVLGRFRDLLGATAHHPAMLVYLDNERNIVRRGEGDAQRGLNENYAREVMELHTLGADGGYTQGDVMSLARILSGWRLPPPNHVEQGKHGFYFDATVHAPGTKTFLGQVIAEGGEAEGERALDMLARSPATARHIAYQLAQYFVADEPDPALVELLARRFTETDGDIRAVLAALFKSPEFWQPAAIGDKFKTPYEYVVSAIRATGQPVSDGVLVGDQVTAEGERLYGKMTPDGYKNAATAWLSPDAMTERIIFANKLASGRLPLARPFDASGHDPQHDYHGEPVDEATVKASLDGIFSQHTLDTVARAKGPLRAALLLASPEFMMR